MQRTCSAHVQNHSTLDSMPHILVMIIFHLKTISASFAHYMNRKVEGLFLLAKIINKLTSLILHVFYCKLKKVPWHSDFRSRGNHHIKSITMHSTIIQLKLMYCYTMIVIYWKSLLISWMNQSTRFLEMRVDRISE